MTNGRPNGSTAPWTSDVGPTLADTVRDRLRGLVDPLPPFEAAQLRHPDGTIGVLRVYESADTPHVTLQSGAVFVREGAADTDTAHAGKAAPGVRSQRIYEARQIRSRQQLLDLAARGAQAERRVQVLLDPTSPLALTNRQLALSPPGTTRPSGEAYVTERGATIFVRLAPLTLPARFRSWVTTTAAAAAVVGAAEELSVQRGLTTGSATPHPDGVDADGATGVPQRCVADEAPRGRAPDAGRRRCCGCRAVARPSRSARPSTEREYERARGQVYRAGGPSRSEHAGRRRNFSAAHAVRSIFGDPQSHSLSQRAAETGLTGPRARPTLPCRTTLLRFKRSPDKRPTRTSEAPACPLGICPSADNAMPRPVAWPP